jgi:hypothetical protein
MRNNYEVLNQRVTRGFITLLVIAGSCFAVWAYRDYDKRMNTYSCTPYPVIVYQGATLWQIANDHCVGNISLAVDDLVDEYGTLLQIGQVINLKSKP